jgi:threonine/homoserine/homoserine lactone efflux protein
MVIETWLAYTLAASIVLVIPGPTILLVISQAMVQGRRSVTPLTLGVMAGDFSALTLSLLGLGAILAASAALFSLLKWLGAAYLIYLGIKLWRTQVDPRIVTTAAQAAGAHALFTRAFGVTTLNPKGIVFFVAFLPQFVTAARPVVPQLLILGSTFVILGGINALLYGLLAGRLGETLQQPRIRRRLNRGGGCVLMGAGLFTAALERTG